MKNKDLILANITKNNPIINCHKHAFTKDHVPNDFESIRISKNKVLGIPMQDWFLKPIEGIMKLIGELPLLPKNWKDTVIRTRNFINILDLKDSTAVFESSLALETQPCDKNSINILLGMDMRLGCHGVMNKTIEEQAQELIAVRNKYPERVLIFYPVDPNQTDMVTNAMQALTAWNFDGIKVYPSEGYLPSHPALMTLFSYCEENKIPVISHNSSANMHHPDWKYRIFGKILKGSDWDDTDQNVVLANEGAVQATYNAINNWIPVLQRFPNLYLDIAHFGGNWDDYLAGKPNTWQQAIIDIVTNPKYPNVYTDFAYTFSNPVYAKGLRTLLASNIALSKKVLHGTDFCMVMLEGTYSDLVKNFYTLMGDYWMNIIARENPKRFLNL